MATQKQLQAAIQAAHMSDETLLGLPLVDTYFFRMIGAEGDE